MTTIEQSRLVRGQHGKLLILAAGLVAALGWAAILAATVAIGIRHRPAPAEPPHKETP